MQYQVRLLAVTVALALTATDAQAVLKIGSAATANMSCSNGVCVPTAKTAVLNVGDLENLLTSGSVTITTTGTGVEADDIHVNAAFTWSNSNTLSLEAHRSIAVNAGVPIGGLSGLTLDTGSTGALLFGKVGNITFANLSSILAINGVAYTLVNTVKGLASVVANNPGGNYAFASSYDAGQDGTYTFSPVSTDFTGTFEGLGNTILNLSVINRSKFADIGLFAEIGNLGVVQNLRLAQVNIKGGNQAFVGGLVGVNDGYLNRDTVSGTVAGKVSRTNGDTVGGLAAFNSGTIEWSFTSATIRVLGDASVGGLVGGNTGIIRNSSATGSVSAGDYGIVGGLAGWSQTQGSTAIIADSYASGPVTDTGIWAEVGGLVGQLDGIVDHSFATGSVAGGGGINSFAGGLAGFAGFTGWICDSYATGAITAGDQGFVGGLVGIDGILLARTYATGAVTGGDSAMAGGLVGQLTGAESGPVGAIENSYATGNIAGGGSADVGGLVGGNILGSGHAGTIASSYSTGSVTGDGGSFVGGSIGDNQAPPGNFRKAYWDTTTSGTGIGVGEGDNSGVKALTTAQLQFGLPRGFKPTIWAENSNINGGLPYLLAIPPPK